MDSSSEEAVENDTERERWQSHYFEGAWARKERGEVVGLIGEHRYARGFLRSSMVISVREIKIQGEVLPDIQEF